LSTIKPLLVAQKQPTDPKLNDTTPQIHFSQKG